jgi:ribose-phosphate pyrophosphokinase
LKIFINEQFLLDVMTDPLMYNRGKLGIISCESGRHFAEKVVERLKEIIKKEQDGSDELLRLSKETIFANTEIKTELGESIRNQDVYIFQDVENESQGLSVNDNLMALKTAINAAKLSNAHSITAVIPVYPYARQDKPKTREGISAAMIARELEDCGASRVITLDVHNEAIAGFFRTAVLENLRASKDLMDYVKNNIGTENLIVVAADVGGAPKADFFARRLGTKLAIMHKERDYTCANCVERMNLVGDVTGKDVLVAEDMIDTAGTLVTAAKKLKEMGAKRVFFSASLAMFNGPAVERIDKAYAEGIITKVIGTNVIFKELDFAKEHPWYGEVSLERYFARVIYNINKGKSITKLLD